MANTLGGFRPVRTGIGAWTGRVGRYYVPSTDSAAIYLGDPVKLSGATDGSGVRVVTKAAAGDAIVGIMIGIAPVPNSGTVQGGASPTLDLPQYRNASVAKYVYVIDDPAAEFEVLTSGTFAESDIALNANHVASSGSTTTGTSNATLDGSTKATTATLTFKTLEVVQTPDNDPSGSTKKVRVLINNHQLRAGTGSAGV